MKPRSAKAKGRRLQQEVQQLILERFKPELEEDDIKVAIMGESGEDIKLSPLARRLFPYSVECKNVEKLNVWSAIEQAEENCKDNTSALLVFKRNHSKTYIAMELDKFLDLTTPKNKTNEVA
jgi:hypothetical protein